MSEITNARRWGTLAICCLAMLLLAVDLTVLHLAVPKLVEAMNPSATEILWIADVYGFALAGLLVTMGNLGDRLGRKRLLLIGCGAFGVASVVTAYASTPELLIAARALLGIAGATIAPSTLSLVRNAFTDPKQRTTAIGVWSGVAVLGFGFGPLVGGALLTSFWWGSVFLINVPVVIAILIAGILVLPESRNPRPGRLDLVSVLLSVVGIVGVVYAVKQAAHAGIGQLEVGIAALVGIVTLIVFVRRQSTLGEPLIDIKLFKQRAFTTTVTTTLVAIFAQLALPLACAQYLQLVVGWSPLKAGLAGLPGMAGAMIGAILAGALVTRLGRAGTVALALCLSAIVFVLCAQLTTEIDYPFMLLAMTVSGAGIALAMTVATDTVLAVVPKERAGAASAISETATELGGALGIAILGSVLSSVYRGSLPPGMPDAVRESLGGAVAIGGPTLDAARSAFMDGLQVTMFSCAGLVAVLAVSVLFTMRGVPKVIPEAEERAPAHA